MPNHVQNRITFIGTEKEVKQVFDFLKGEDSLIDFNKIIPMPEELNITSGSEGDSGLDYLLYCQNNKEHAHLKSNFERVESLPADRKASCISLGLKYLLNKEKYGYKTWYEWSCANWGTKWNAYSTRRHANMLHFQTAWSGVPGLVQKITERFPNVLLEYEFADEDLGSNVGHGYSEDGEFYFSMVEADSDEAWDIVFDLWDCRDDFEKVDGKWRWKKR